MLVEQLGDLERAGQLYRDAVAAAKEHILAGDIFQVVLAQRFDLEGDYDPFSVYRVLRLVNPSPYMYLLRMPGDEDREPFDVIGSSPEALREANPAELRTVAGISFLKDEEVIRTPARPLIRNLDDLPLPAWDLLPMARYGAGSRNHPALGAIEFVALVAA